ncbi:MAG: PqqD family protein [Acidobacteriota bacterium]|nr:PqqD family protein [Acidobacteriota bacterium]
MSGADPVLETNLLDVAPVRLADWEEVDGRAVLLRPRPAARGLKQLLEILSYQLSARRIRLDEAGSFAWLRLDGRRTVAEIAAEMRGELGSAVEPAEERLGTLVRQLRGQGLVAYPGVDDAAGLPPGTRRGG